MANPNIVNVTKILANTVTGAFVASNTVFHTNPSSSGRVDKINSILVTNVDGVANADFDLIITNAGANNFLIKTVLCPADSAIVAVDKNSGFYLLENSKIGGAASAAGDLVYTISLEQIY